MYYNVYNIGYNSFLSFIKDDGTTMADYTIIHNTDDDIDSAVVAVNKTFNLYFLFSSSSLLSFYGNSIFHNQI